MLRVRDRPPFAGLDDFRVVRPALARELEREVDREVARPLVDRLLPRPRAAALVVRFPSPFAARSSPSPASRREARCA